MTTLIVLLALVPTLILLVDYARHDRFAGRGVTHPTFDDLGPIADREHLPLARR